MISSLRGTIAKHEVPWVTVDVGGVGYAVQCVLGLWEALQEGKEAHLHIFTLVREDRLELFGFSSIPERTLFLRFLDIAGVGPRTALNLASVPAGILYHAAENNDARALSALKGIGKKMAEKLLVELKALVEKGILVASGASGSGNSDPMDEDVIEALANLGYDRRIIMKKLRELPKEAETTEERVKGLLQVL